MSYYSDHVLIFLNCVVKAVLREEDYTQIGRLPKFFDPKEKKAIDRHKLESWPGYLTTSRLLAEGFFLNIDTCTKFVN
jgi:hypothetical protein